jgi:hypothetical protein
VVSSYEFNRQGVKGVKSIVIRDNRCVTLTRMTFCFVSETIPPIQQRAIGDIRAVDCRLGIKVERGGRDQSGERPAAHRRILAD